MGDGPARNVDGRGRERKLYQMRLENKYGRKKILNIHFDELAWFESSPNGLAINDPDCICSYCGFVFPEGDVPIRLSHSCHQEDCACKNKEALLHQACFRLLEVKPC